MKILVKYADILQLIMRDRLKINPRQFGLPLDGLIVIILRDRLMVGQQPLKLFILVRVQVPQPIS